MRKSRIVAAIVLLLGASLGAPTAAEEAAGESPYSADLWMRSTLSGDWGGLRSDLSAKGVTLDMSLTQSAQGIVHNGKQAG